MKKKGKQANKQPNKQNNMNKNCEEKLGSFIKQEMNITHHIEFGNVHRFGKRPPRENDPPRQIVLSTVSLLR